MTQIVLNGEQADALHAASEPIQLIDGQGRVLGIANPIHSSQLTPKEIGELESLADSDGPWLSPAQVREHLTHLE
jgi:hypothetical protein